MSYKVEELLALRDSVSESAVSIDRFADEDVIKEHVLRPCASANLASAASDKNLRLSATPALAVVVPHKKPSPSPSIKRGKAEKLLKEHGSPPGMRVTAGGRVVPSDLPPLASNRFVNNTFKPLPLRTLAVGSTMPMQPPGSDTSNVTRLEVVGNQPVLYVGERAYALPALDPPSSIMPPVIPGVLEATAKPSTQSHMLSTQASFTGAQLGLPRTHMQTPFAGLDLATLKGQQALKRQELRTVEQTEVLQASHQTEAWRAGIIEKKRNLIIEIDALRKQISALEATENNVPHAQSNGFPGPISHATASGPPTSFVPHFQQPIPSHTFGFQGPASYSPMMMYQPPFSTFPNLQVAESVPIVSNLVPPPQSPGSAGRRSHAIEIKQPRENSKRQVASTLDPKSPTYEPVAKQTTTKDRAPPTPSPAKRSPWRTNGVSQSDKHDDQTLSQKPSLSSIDTTDFFPTNTHEHSSTRIAPTIAEPKQVSHEVQAVPSTPDKNWPASPWNEGKSVRSSSKAVAKLKSWPEAFGKQPSLPSLIQATTGQEPAPFTTAEPPKSAFTSNVNSCSMTEQRAGAGENWSLFSSKSIHPVPSTYQEGYQAGYDHVGIPDSLEVLKGYIQGLLQFLADESKKDHNNSLRGLVAGSTPHDSAVSMSFNRIDGSIRSQENIRSTKASSAMDTGRNSSYSPQDAPLTYAMCNEAATGPRLRTPTVPTYLTQTDTLTKDAFAYRPAALPAAENDVSKKNQDKGTASRADWTRYSSTYPRQFSGNQASGRTYGTPVPMQRYYLTPTEVGSRGLYVENTTSTRPMANQRLSGLDGAMDDLADLVLDTHIHEQRPTTESHGSMDAVGSLQSVGGDAPCFGPSSSTGKQKAPISPTELVSSERSEVTAPSPVNGRGSPKKSGEHSPAKAKLEQVTNKFRRAKKDDLRNVSPEKKKERAQRWHTRFQRLKERELKEIRDYVDNNPRP